MRRWAEIAKTPLTLKLATRSPTHRSTQRAPRVIQLNTKMPTLYLNLYDMTAMFYLKERAALSSALYLSYVSDTV